MNKEEYQKLWQEYRKLWHDRIDRFVFDSDFIFEVCFEFKKRINKMEDISDKLKAKFDKGMEEHGLGFEKVDFDAEIENEVLDICNYLIGKNYIREFLEEHAHNPQSPETQKE